MASSQTTNLIRKVYARFRGNLALIHDWMTLRRPLMYEDGLGTVLSGVEAALSTVDLEDGTSGDEIATHEGLKNASEKNGKLYTRLLLATPDCPDMYASIASLVVKAHAPIQQRCQ